MPSNVYTVTLWQVVTTPPAYPLAAPSPPVGFVWVVRDVKLTSPQLAGGLATTAAGSVAVNGVPIVSTPTHGTLGGCFFSWDEVRQVVTSSDELTFSAGDGGWAVRVGGYQLSTP